GFPPPAQEGGPAHARRAHEGAQEVRTEEGEEGSPVHQALDRTLVWPDCQNTRDLGGLPLRGGVTRSRVLVRSDNVGHLNATGVDAMRAYGVTKIGRASCRERGWSGVG